MDYQYRKDSKASQEPQEATLRKAKLKALHLLERMDRTEAQLREKLLQAEFAPEIVEQAIAYVYSFGYLDDERYVRNYMECRQQQKSRRQLIQELQYKKGVSPELIQKVCEELETVDEKMMIRRFLEKKHYDPFQTDEKQQQKLMAALLRMGFQMNDIRAVLKEMPEE
jgi:regulatory protein